MHLLLVGYRGCGKSTVGPHVAARLGREFVDLDDRVIGRFVESSVSAIWAAHGEAAWRQQEASMLEEVLAEARSLVVALGGGTPMIDSARRRIDAARRSGQARVIWLECPSRVLVERLTGDPGDRPGLTGADPVAEIERVLREREDTYRAIADAVVDGMQDAEAVSGAVLAAIA